MNICRICNKNTNNKVYCSPQCQHEGLKILKVERISITCDNCLVSIQKLPKKIKNKNYCSRKCADENKKITMLGQKNSMYGKKASEQTIEKKSFSMKKVWKKEEYREKRAKSLELAMEGRNFWFGCKPEDTEKKKNTLIKKYGKHPFSDEEFRKKCDERCLKLYGKTSLEMAREKIDKNVIETRRRSLIETITNLPYEEYEKKLSKKEKYYKMVRRITESQEISILENYHKRGAGIGNDIYHLDHIIPISYGLLNDIDPYIIGHISNLRFIPAVENIKKGAKYG